MKVIGLAGGSASGKSTVARGVADALGSRCLRVAHDWYYRTLPAQYISDPSSYNFDHPDALETELLVACLDALRGGHSTRAPDYDFTTHMRREPSRWHALEPRPFVLVEGILVLSHAALRSRLDLRVFVDAPESVRLQRRIARDARERGRSEVNVRAQYHRTVGPMHDRFVEPSRSHADLVLDGTKASDQLVKEILHRL